MENYLPTYGHHSPALNISQQSGGYNQNMYNMSGFSQNAGYNSNQQQSGNHHMMANSASGSNQQQLMPQQQRPYVFVSNLPLGFIQTNLEAFFMNCGQFAQDLTGRNMVFVKKPRNNNLVQYANITFLSEESIQKALQMNGQSFMGNTIIVQRGRPKNFPNQVPISKYKLFLTYQK